MERGKPDLCPSGNFSANLSKNNFKNYRKHLKVSNTYNKGVSRNGSIAALNEHMNCARVPYGLNESTILETLSILERIGNESDPGYWLMTCRIAEMTVLCAGHYADACEFSAAGDLLVNPRKIFIHIKGYSKPLIKHRHARISEQLNPAKIRRDAFLHWFRTNVILQAGKKPLLVDLYDKLTESGRVASGFLGGIKTRMNRIADTIGFLSAWQVACAEDLIERMRRETPETQEFIHANLCHFNTGMFHFIGQEIRRINHDPAYRSPLLADPSDTWNP